MSLKTILMISQSKPAKTNSLFISLTIPEDFRSSISIHNLRACNEIEKENYSYLKDHFVLEGTQTAIIPFLIGAGGSLLAAGGIGCLIGNRMRLDGVLLTGVLGIPLTIW